ncbi:hypothetical protein QBC33DRAFT_200814 [Phialemonium atrogriseum]|uniref:Uncharacterized protein n=1 Tax=Phialemonium atrogriseum TaxID=1093897 RepID=A0AAJ0BUZ5_9PEZI|nr:uncharacterized protein QBC33DRAFT_200814 [Phialemonium atrogriseum]KAK1764477.1 hypothetical protein QBC33DRAFT_200814 [Phialemonium atrogriseum]
MRLQLKPGWHDMVPKKCRAYPLNERDRQVKQEVAKMESQGKLTRTTRQVSFSFPVFVVYETMPDGTQKGRMVVDIRGLNKITMSDSYPMKSQDDIMAKVAKIHRNF